MEKQRMIDSVLTPEIRQQIADIEAEFDGLMAPAQEMISQMEAEIKATVSEAGQSVKGAGLQAVFVNGRVSWDTKALEGYAAAHPEIERFKKVGSPSVQIRVVK